MKNPILVLLLATIFVFSGCRNETKIIHKRIDFMKVMGASNAKIISSMDLLEQKDLFETETDTTLILTLVNEVHALLEYAEGPLTMLTLNKSSNGGEIKADKSSIENSKELLILLALQHVYLMAAEKNMCGEVEPTASPLFPPVRIKEKEESIDKYMDHLNDVVARGVYAIEENL